MKNKKKEEYEDKIKEDIVENTEKDDEEEFESGETISEEDIKNIIGKTKRKHAKSKENNKIEKAFFFQRFMAYVIDIFIVALVSSIIMFPFVDTSSQENLNNSATEVMQKYMSQEIDVETYVSETMTISYQMARNNGLATLITIVFEILYFIVYQLYNGGQTIGKKFMKIKVESIDGKSLTMNQMIFRALIINSILLEIISFGFMIFASRDVYFYGVGLFEAIQYFVLIISVFMIIYGKNGQGLHDKLANTRVIKY